MGSLIWFVVSDMEWRRLVASMNGDDGWLRWLASKVAPKAASMDGVNGWRRWWTGVFETEGTDVEVTLCPNDTHSSSLLFV